MAEVINLDFESGFIDSHGHTVTPTSATIVTAGPLSGLASATVAPGGSINVAGVSLGNSAFTYSAIFRIPTTGPAWQYYFADCGVTGLVINLYEDTGDVLVDVGLNGYFYISETLPAFTYDVIHHIEVARSGTTVYLFFNGALLVSYDYGAQNLTASSFSLANDFAGVIDYIKLDVGAALHTATFLPDYGATVAPVYVADGGTSSAVFRAKVVIDGVDLTNDVIGTITIEQDEGSATIADLTLMPAAGTPLYLPSWTGKTVVISIGDYSTGVMVDETIRFTGVVDLPAIDLDQGTLSLRCTDDLQGKVGAMTTAALATLIGGYYSPAVFKAGSSSWVYAQDRLSTVRASLDISPAGIMRVTSWTAKPAADLNFTDDDVLDGSLAIDMAERSSMVNQIDITFGYRFPRMKSEGHVCNFDALSPIGFEQYIIDDKYIPARQQVVSAIEAAGGSVVSIAYDALPTTSVILHVGGAAVGVWVPNPSTDPLLCTGWQAVVSFDYAQDFDETHNISVSTPLSIAEVGAVKETMSGSLQADYADTTSVETTATLYKNSFTSIPPLNSAAIIGGHTNATEVTLPSDSDRAAADNAMETLIATAKTRIATAHRANTVSAVVPLNGALDISKTVGLATASVTAKGKVRKVVDTIDTENAIARSAFDLAISGIAGVGITHLEDPTTAPAGTVASVSSSLAPPTVVFNNATAGDHTITITFPGVEDAERDRASPVIASAYDAKIIEDVFGVTL